MKNLSTGKCCGTCLYWTNWKDYLKAKRQKKAALNMKGRCRYAGFNVETKAYYGSMCGNHKLAQEPVSTPSPPTTAVSPHGYSTRWKKKGKARKTTLIDTRTGRPVVIFDGRITDEFGNVLLSSQHLGLIGASEQEVNDNAALLVKAPELAEFIENYLVRDTGESDIILRIKARHLLREAGRLV